MKDKNNKIETDDYRGKLVIFTIKKWKQKTEMHPELRKDTFIKRVQEAIQNPDEVWQDYGDKKRKRCYYKKYSIYTYVKVVLWFTTKPCEVVTAYEVNYIKESKYPEIKQLL